MYVGVYKLTLYIYGVASLKEKRRVLQKIKDRFRNKFHFPLVEVEDQDLWQKAVLGGSTVSADDRYLEVVFEKMKDFLETFPEVELIDSEREIFTY